MTAVETASAAATPVAPAEAPNAAEPRTATLDELMMAMDVVDTLRHNQSIVETELNQAGRDAAMKERLREIYKGQGLDVPDHVLDSGIKALSESRFVYTPPKPGVQTYIAKLWVKRRKIGLWFAGILAALGISFGGYQFLIVGPQQAAEQRARVEVTETLPRLLETAHLSVQAEAKEDEPKRMADAYLADGRVALRGNRVDDARAALKKLADLEALLRQEYVLRIVQSGDSGIWRIPDVNESTKNFYLMVQAVAPDGRVLTVPVTNEETNKTREVDLWGVRVGEELFDAVRADKRKDGIIQDNIVGTKSRGFLAVVYRMPVLGGAITEWGD